MIDVLGPERRRRRTPQEKIAIVQQSFEPGMSVSMVARQHGVAASQLFMVRNLNRFFWEHLTIKSDTAYSIAAADLRGFDVKILSSPYF